MKAVILGAGESGVGAALLAKQKGYQVFVSDYGKIKENFKKELEENQILFEENKHTNESIFDADCIIKSPGIPDTVNIIQESLKRKIPVISEIEFAAKFCKGKIIAITGSNGKTTTTKLIYHLLHTAGLSVGIGGNVGFSFARLLTQQQRDCYVLELSSFQLDNCYDFRPGIALLLNITPDHLDRYDYDISKYAASKFRIIQKQEDSDLFIYNEKDKNIQSYIKDNTIGMDTIPVSDKFFDNKTIRTLSNKEYTLEGTNLKGPHNAFNATCALLVAEKFGVEKALLQKGLNTFINAPHRLEFVGQINEVDYINDSKATNVDSVYYGLLAMEKPLVWVAGGIDKGNDYSAIIPLVKEKVKAMICLGADNEKLIKEFSPIVSTIKETRTAAETIEIAMELAEPGMAVILSPACSSFDLFENFAQRGDLFRAAVQSKLENQN